MQLKKITEFGKTGYFYVGESEIFTINWNNGANPDFYAFGEDREIRQVTKDYFATKTIGDDYRLIENQLPSSIESYKTAKDENSNQYFCFYQDGIVYGFDKKGKKFLEWCADEIGVGHPIYDIKYQKNGLLWLAFPTGQTVTQVSLEQQKETFKIGEYSWDDTSEPLSYPESISINDNCLFIPNMGNNKLFRVNLKTLDIEHINTFEEKLWQYEQTSIGTFIITDTGLYEIEKE